MDTNYTRNVYVVIFDLSNKSKNYALLQNIIKEYQFYAKLGEFSYLISTIQTPVEVRTQLKHALESNDKLFIGKIIAPAAWTNMSAGVSEWIKNQLK